MNVRRLNKKFSIEFSPRKRKGESIVTAFLLLHRNGIIHEAPLLFQPAFFGNSRAKGVALRLLLYALFLLCIATQNTHIFTRLAEQR
jgi:hypothetical protein